MRFESKWLAFSLIAGSLAGKVYACPELDSGVYVVYGVRRQPNRTSYTFVFLSSPVHLSTEAVAKVDRTQLQAKIRIVS